MAEAKPAAFLDRDGVINIDRGYVGRVTDFELIEGAAEAISLLNRSGYLVFVVTNQSGIARGYFTEADFFEVTAYMNALLAQGEAHIDDIRYCPYHPNADIARYRACHPWRKPAPGMILDLVQKWNVDLDSSFLIGNSARDVEAARAAGVKGYLYEQGNLLDFLRSSALKTDRDVN